MGSNREACQAGKNPKNKPIPTETPTANSTEPEVTTAVRIPVEVIRKETPQPMITPIMPPRKVNTAASIRNCPQISGPLGSEGFANADFPASFHDGHQHDIHDPDATYQQRNAGDSAQK